MAAPRRATTVGTGAGAGSAGRGGVAGVTGGCVETAAPRRVTVGAAVASGRLPAVAVDDAVASGRWWTATGRAEPAGGAAAVSTAVGP